VTRREAATPIDDLEEEATGTHRRIGGLEEREIGPEAHQSRLVARGVREIDDPRVRRRVGRDRETDRALDPLVGTTVPERAPCGVWTAPGDREFAHGHVASCTAARRCHIPAVYPIVVSLAPARACCV